jgi:cholesterol transport system auxiliary component
VSFAGLAAAALLLQGCAALGGSTPQLDTFELTSAAAAADGPARSRTQLLVAEPVALSALDGSNIVIRTGPGSIEFLGGAQWSDRLPRIVQSRLIEAIQASGRVGGVGRPGEGLAIDFQIVTEIRQFGVRVAGAPRAEVELFVKLLNDRNGVVRAQRGFSAVAPLVGTGNAAYAAALDAAFAQATREIVAWTLASL